MRTSALLGLVGVLGFSTLVGCAGAAADETEAQGGAATSVGVFANGTYDDALKIVVKGNQISGSYYSQVGDLSAGGASCGFTFAGLIEGETAQITAADGYSITGGELVSDGGGVSIRLNNLPGACGRTSPGLTEKDGDYHHEDGRENLASDIAGFRTVKAEKAFFHDRAGGAARAAYAVNGDALEITGPEQGGYLPARFKSTKGFIKTADLVATNAPVAKDTLRGDYALRKNEGKESSFEVITSHNRDMLFNLSAVRLTGGFNNGTIEEGHAKIVGDTATWQGDSCSVSFAFSSDAKTVTVEQTGSCNDFGFGVDVSGTYDRK